MVVLEQNRDIENSLHSNIRIKIQGEKSLYNREHFVIGNSLETIQGKISEQNNPQCVLCPLDTDVNNRVTVITCQSGAGCHMSLFSLSRLDQMIHVIYTEGEN